MSSTAVRRRAPPRRSGPAPGSGTGRGGSNEGSGIYRIDYVADGRLPDARVTATPDSGGAPPTVTFSSVGSGPTHTYT